jgi:hypothetical protein
VSGLLQEQHAPRPTGIHLEQVQGGGGAGWSGTYDDQIEIVQFGWIISSNSSSLDGDGGSTKLDITGGLQPVISNFVIFLRMWD